MRKNIIGIMYDGDKRDLTRAVIDMLEKGPSWSTIGTSAITQQAALEATEQYQRWVQTWILPDLKQIMESEGLL